jgi:hypothetical protein
MAPGKRHHGEASQWLLKAHTGWEPCMFLPATVGRLHSSGHHCGPVAGGPKPMAYLQGCHLQQDVTAEPPRGPSPLTMGKSHPKDLSAVLRVVRQPGPDVPPVGVYLVPYGNY